MASRFIKHNKFLLNAFLVGFLELGCKVPAGWAPVGRKVVEDNVLNIYIHFNKVQNIGTFFACIDGLILTLVLL